MGRITVFSLENCPHCKRAKAALKERSIPFVEISLTTHPSRRSDMISLSDRLSVPQVFFNDKHIGGADDTIQFLEKEWVSDSLAEILSKPNPTDQRLREITDDDKAVLPKDPLPRAESDQVVLPGGTKMSVLELMETKLKPRLSGSAHSAGLLGLFKGHKNTFTGAEAMEAWKNDFGLDNEEETIAFGSQLLKRKIMHLINHKNDILEEEFSASKTSFYRLQCFHTPHILNSYRIWDTTADTNDPMGVLDRLKKLLGKVESSVTNDKGEVDYKQAVNKEGYAKFEEAVCELQLIDMGTLDHKTLLAFGINLYNVMIKYSFMKVGIYTNSIGLLSYFTAIKFCVGGHLFSFHDLESGILRGNRPAPYSPFVQIGPSGKDPRQSLVVPDDKVDCRIHFGLNCGAKSCPPVKSFTAEDIDEELRIVAMAFFEDDDNAQVDVKCRTLSLSQIISWYRIDFASSNNLLPRTIVQFLRGDKKDQLQAMIDDGKSIKVKFKTYDWTTNASDFVPYRKANLQADTTPTLGLGIF